MSGTTMIVCLIVAVAMAVSFRLGYDTGRLRGDAEGWDRGLRARP